MAYKKKDGSGPYPNKAGEYCGNHQKGSPALRMTNETSEDAERRQDAWLARMRFGRPRPCHAGTTEDMEAMGYVGLYLLNDSPTSFADDVEIETPDELKEPAATEPSANDTKGKP